MVDVIDCSTVITSLWTEPVVDVGVVLMGLRAIVPQMSTFTTDLAWHMHVHGLDGVEHCLLLMGMLIKPFY